MISPSEAAVFLRDEAVEVHAELVRIVRVTTVLAAANARAMFGVRQRDWPSLAESTIQTKERLGYGGPPDFDPLLRTGEMRDSVQARSDGLVGEIFSDDPKMVFSELGTAKEPPRPVLEPALLEAVMESDGLLRELMGTIE